MESTKYRGTKGEEVVVDYLLDQGYNIMERNVRFGRLEVDIVAQLKEEIVFFEVKTRFSDSLIEAEGAFKNGQIQRLKRVMVLYAEKNNVDLDRARLDFVAVFINRKNKKASLRHFVDILK